jgi:enamine deaminase RidA (YjgF/YER057c/UK114 family)
MRKLLLRRTPAETPALQAVGSYAQGYRAGNFVFLQGQTGLTLDGEIVAPGDPAGQTRQALENIRALMELAGGTLNDVVKIVVYVTEREYRAQVYPIIDEFFGAQKPCSTGLVVKGLAIEELVVEIDAYGIVDDVA